MCLKTKAKDLISELKQKWQLLQNTPNVFAYKLNVTKCRYLPGSCCIYVELNPERTQLRRLPQSIPNLRSPFDEQKFNFKKINPLELIMDVCHENANISMIINKSPLTQFHTLICPDVNGGHAQRLTPLALNFSVAFLLDLSKEDNAFRIGYNSPGALASVNHLHLHLMYLPVDLYIDNAKLVLLLDDYVYRLSEDMPTEAICYVFKKTGDKEDMNVRLQKLYNFITWLCDQNIPHNLFMTLDRSDAVSDDLKVFIYARENFCIIKELSDYNVAFCEFSGYVPVGDENLYNNINENEVLQKIKEETSQVYIKVYNYFNLKKC